MSGRYYGDLSIGDEFVTDARTVTESDVMLFAGLTSDYNYLHVDFKAAEAGPFGAPVAHGMLVISMSQGLFVSSRLLHGTSLGLLGFKDWRFLKPVFFGDTIDVISQVTSRRITSRGDRGVCEFGITVRNQNGVSVQTGSASILVAVSPRDHE